MTSASEHLNALNRRIVACRQCPRLVAWREAVASRKRPAFADWDYWGRPVPGFGDADARVLVVGLAPGAHGSNRTGRQFTGDASGRFLFPALFRAGFATTGTVTDRDDGLRLHDLYITAAARCVPPGNKPAPSELDRCQPFLERELTLIQPSVIVCLGRVAFDRVRRILRVQHNDNPRLARALKQAAFKHGAVLALAEARWLICSYHPSQQNTLTGRLTPAMFDRIWMKARRLAGGK